MYDSLLIDQSLGLNRRRDDGNDVKTEVRMKLGLIHNRSEAIKSIGLFIGDCV